MADPFGRLVGTLVAAAFGAVFVLANTDAFPAPWAAALRIAAVVAAVALAVGAVVVFRRAARSATGAGQGRTRWGRGYWLVVAGEVVALAAGLWLINGVLDRPDLAVVWVALVVGVHFVVLGRVWRFGRFVALGAVMSALAVLAAVAAVLTGSVLLVQLLAGVGSGAALLGFAGAALSPRIG
ncbi:hypothetical protein Acsp06_57880 [Actinomycetospora sp. NBRC 106375]|uniref:hypothetical protein n=1 Tax=Actinomycetospora sp. NBRC 106375 TaxID=3032207 RepID=UPI0024A3116C|nr:hypothetical protein [Actinomycetospora sp. NBRC 106375]GLZ49603.1 hypothetical protein Acsp06_57880 [Actinomycetospora sp. NBRC 106375]